MSVNSDNLFDAALACIEINDPGEKAGCAPRLYQQWCSGQLAAVTLTGPVRIENPGRPMQPRLVNPKRVPKRGFNSRPGLNKLAHAIAHIEFNAINLALDAVYRFRDMPDDFYTDWLRVAAEESSHFIMLSEYLLANEVHYGDYDAHNGLWEMALKTEHDVMVRMALVPRVLEARGLDVTPMMITRLKKAGEQQLIDILEVIHKEEIGHVLVGTKWFNFVCQQRGLSPSGVFTDLLRNHVDGIIQGPFDEASRLQAGFTEEEMQHLVAISERKEVVA
jgi:uncharacterized ferritin-like protein (DUF455 family)